MHTHPTDTTTYRDVWLYCLHCKAEFLYTADEQRRFAAYQWVAPKRCLRCRAAKREARGE
jgi:hypothetical protein